ncbi:MAG: hypothetical protein IPM92_16460 [Saprospiraceae bacterium]|nr:hypothetical protein [Saprospiraceae bacterium]
MLKKPPNQAAKSPYTINKNTLKFSLRGDTEYLVYKVEGLHQAQPATQTPPPANPQILPVLHQIRAVKKMIG